MNTTRVHEVRPRSEIEEDRQKCLNTVERIGPSRYMDGAIAVYDWILGSAEAPVGPMVSPTAEAVGNVEKLVLAAIYGKPAAPDVISQDWAVGVEHAAMWSRGLAERGPGR
ncbi:hypothetical protein [Natronoglycomyces albus]|uniref:Uncharacterized protein n=1 Tax=Natronoglycomyces albus TaxID=2811108 RepID=A0A895XUV5_9ACTN|nr:hypothetical protein [Natronoglycomyces albus]QSB07165.1 hypothetical protein JQS30_17130 [Natronoglycomyces albus]